MATFAAYENVAVHICTCRPCNAWLMLCYRIMLQTLLFYLLLISALALPAFRLPPMRAIPTDNTLKIQEPPSVYLKMRKCQFCLRLFLYCNHYCITFAKVMAKI